MDVYLLKTIVHYTLHFLFPVLIAFTFFRKNWVYAYVLMLGTMLVDLDHLLAVPVFDPHRMSVGFHLLHSYPAIAIYIGLVFFKGKLRIIGIGLLFHMITDFQDYYFWPH